MADNEPHDQPRPQQFTQIAQQMQQQPAQITQPLFRTDEPEDPAS